MGSLRTLRDGSGHGWRANAAAYNLTNFGIFARAARMTTAPATGEVHPWLSLGGLNATDESGFWIGYLESGGTTYLKVAFMTSAGVEKSVTVAYSMTVGRWYAVAGTWDNTSKLLTLYAAARKRDAGDSDVVTLTQLGQTNFPAVAPNAATAPLRLGADTDASGVITGASADFADMGLYDAALSKAALEALLTRRLVYGEASLVAGWRGDEAEGSTLYDRSGNGHDLALVGGATWSSSPQDLYYPGLVSNRLIGVASATRRPQTTITASSEDTNYPASRLKVARQDHPYRSADVVDPVTIGFDFGAHCSILAVSIRNHNLTSKAVQTLGLCTDADWLNIDYTETLTFHPGRQDHVLTRNYWYRYALYTATDTTNGDGYIQLGNLDFWLCWRNPQGENIVGRATMITDGSVMASTAHADVTTRELPVSEPASFNVEWLRRDQALELYRLLEEAVSSDGYLWTAGDPRRNLPSAGYGLIAEMPSLVPLDPGHNRMHLMGVRIATDFP